MYYILYNIQMGMYFVSTIKDPFAICMGSAATEEEAQAKADKLNGKRTTNDKS